MQEMIYVILTLGKSGSSLLASTFHHNGIPTFKSIIDDGENSQRYEDSMLCDFNRKLFGEKNHSLEMGYPIVIDMDDCTINIMTTIINNRFLQYNNYCLKDPRMAYVYKFWKQVLPEHKVIIQFRNPLEVVAHYNKKKEYTNVIENICKRYKYIYEESLANADDPLFVSYDSLKNHELQHLEKLLGIKLNSQYDAEKHRRRVEGINIEIDDNTKNLYNKLLLLEKTQKESACSYATV